LGDIISDILYNDKEILRQCRQLGKYVWYKDRRSCSYIQTCWR